MLAVFVNMATVLLGSAIGILFRKRIRESYTKAIISALALVTMVIGVTSAIPTQNLLCVIVCMALGTMLGELLRLDDRINGAGDWLKSKVLKGKAEGSRFTEGFVSACILFCVGSMTIMGSLEAGVNRNYSIIFAKSALDFVSSMMFGAAMGIGVTCSALFVLVFQGALTLLASLIAPVMTDAAMAYLSLVGSVLIFCVGLNLVWGKKVRVANMLPAILLAVPAAYLPWL